MENEKIESEYLTSTQLAEMLNVSKRFIVKHRCTGKIPGVVKIGSVYRFKRSAIEKRMFTGQLLLEE